jgi:hypothetical protein
MLEKIKYNDISNKKISNIIFTDTINKIISYNINTNRKLSKAMNGDVDNYSNQILGNTEVLIQNDIERVKRLLSDNVINNLTRNDNFTTINRNIDEAIKNHTPILEFLNTFQKEFAPIIKYIIAPIEVANELVEIDYINMDRAIVEESSQLSTYETMELINNVKKFTLVGDERQQTFISKTNNLIAPPNQVTGKYLVPSDSLFENFKFKFPSITLDFHYRSFYQETIQFSNSYIYGNNLYTLSPNLSTKKDPAIDLEFFRRSKNTKQDMLDSITTQLVTNIKKIGTDISQIIITFSDD